MFKVVDTNNVTNYVNATEVARLVERQYGDGGSAVILKDGTAIETMTSIEAMHDKVEAELLRPIENADTSPTPPPEPAPDIPTGGE